MKNSSNNNNKNLKLKNFDIVIINYVEETKKDELIEELKKLYGEYEPLNTGTNGVISFTGGYSRISPDSRLGTNIIYYDENNYLKKPLPEKLEYFEIRIIKHIPNWYEVICNGRLKKEYLEIAKNEFLEKIETAHTISTPKTFNDAHKEFESFLCPYIMDNIIYKIDSEKRRSYPYLYVGELENYSSSNIIELIEDTHNTCHGIEWHTGGWFSLIEKKHLIQEIGGIHSGLISGKRGFSVLNINPINSEMSNRLDERTREFRAYPYENRIIYTVSIMLFIDILLAYRLEGIKDWEKKNVEFWNCVKKCSNSGHTNNDVKDIIPLQNKAVRLRSDFLYDFFNIRNEFKELDNLIRFSFEYLLSRDFNSFPIEETFFNPINEKEEYIEDHIRSGDPKKGVLLNIIETSQHKKKELLSEINNIDTEQNILASYIRDMLNTNLQVKMSKLTQSLKMYTIIISLLTVIMAILMLLQTKSEIYNKLLAIFQYIISYI